MIDNRVGLLRNSENYSSLFNNKRCSEVHKNGVYKKWKWIYLKAAGILKNDGKPCTFHQFSLR
jgi:hypothetical protein